MKKKLIASSAFLALVASLPLAGSAIAQLRQAPLWDSGFDSFCQGPCVLMQRTKDGVVFSFVDPANSSTKFVRQLTLPKGSVITPPKFVSSVDAQGLRDENELWVSSKTSGTVPPAPTSGTGVVTAQATIYDSRGNAIGVAIIRYYYVNGNLVNVVVEYISLDQGGVE